MPWFSTLYREPLEFAGGMAVVPERPGWGHTFDEQRITALEQAMR
jgi:L-alanine-DL-glutamate epimerase-like enolase superfamily enzyme